MAINKKAYTLDGEALLTKPLNPGGDAEINPIVERTPATPNTSGNGFKVDDSVAYLTNQLNGAQTPTPQTSTPQTPATDDPAAAGTNVTNSSPFTGPTSKPTTSAEFPTVVPGKTYSGAELVAFQQAMSSADQAAMQAEQRTLNRRSKYSSEPSGAGWVSIPLATGGYFEYRAEPDWLGYWSTSPNYTPNTGTAGTGTGTAGTGVGVGSGTSGTGSGTSGTGAPVSGNSNDLTSLLEQWKQAAAEQANGQIDYAVSQAITELERALEDSKSQYKEQAESVARDEMQALDNSALYAEMRGDKGGIGQSQYNEIQAAAAQNRLAVQQAQTKLSTDTARQIADLRAQGEFEKADKALEITQTYLSQLISLEQWAAEFGLSQAQFQASLDQWKKEYDMAMAEFDYKKNYTAQSDAADLARTLLSMGIDVTPEQLTASGYTRQQADEIITLAQLERAAGGGGSSTPTFNSLNDVYEALQSLGITNIDDAVAQAKAWGWTLGDYETWLENNSTQPEDETQKVTVLSLEDAALILDKMEAEGATPEELGQYVHDYFAFTPGKKGDEVLLSIIRRYGIPVREE